ncbi:MAG: hypothetical protein PVH61_35445 [Candidatus Aminicenantes bacterium]
MSEFVKVSGKIERVWDNATTQGRPYKVVELENGERYSLWRKGDFEKVSKGDDINFDYSMSGRWKNIERIYDGSEAEPGPPGKGQDFGSSVNGKYNGAEPGNGNGNGYDGAKHERMVKMSCVKSASNLFTGSKIPFEERADKVIEMARKFKDYICQEDEFDLEPPEPPEPAG